MEGQNVPNARGGGNSPQKSPLEDSDFDPQIDDFLSKMMCQIVFEDVM